MNWCEKCETVACSSPPQSPLRQEEQAAEVPVPVRQLPFLLPVPVELGSTLFSSVAFDSHSLIRSSPLVEQYGPCASSEGMVVNRT